MSPPRDVAWLRSAADSESFRAQWHALLSIAHDLEKARLLIRTAAQLDAHHQDELLAVERRIRQGLVAVGLEEPE